MREIKFRAFDDGKMLSMPITTNYGISRFFGMIREDAIIMQFTGLKDRNGKDIYEGDVIQYHYLKRYTQQSHYDVRPEIDELIIKKASDKVVFYNGFFTLSRESIIDEGCPFITPLSEFGLYSIERVKEDIFGNSLSLLSEEEQSGDCNGNDINNSILGIEIIGNIHESPELLKN